MKFTPFIVAFAAIATVVNAVPMKLERRRFGQEHTELAESTYQRMRDLAVGTPFGEQLGNLSGKAVDMLLAKAPACGQQEVAEQVIDIANEIGGKKKSELIKVAVQYRKLERNTPLDGQPSNFCDKKPRHPELIGVFQAQDPTKVKNKPKAFVSPGEKLNPKPNFKKPSKKQKNGKGKKEE